MHIQQCHTAFTFDAPQPPLQPFPLYFAWPHPLLCAQNFLLQPLHSYSFPLQPEERVNMCARVVGWVRDKAAHARSVNVR